MMCVLILQSLGDAALRVGQSVSTSGHPSKSGPAIVASRKICTRTGWLLETSRSVDSAAFPALLATVAIMVAAYGRSTSMFGLISKK